MSSPQSHAVSFTIEVSPGELLDKMSILQIKSERVGDPAKLKNIRYELQLYEDIVRGRIPGGKRMTVLTAELKAVNEALWTIEDEIRACEARGDFGDDFVALARSVYRTNDRRAAIKREINVLCGSSIVEEKSYTQY
jgi:hypothetical protein